MFDTVSSADSRDKAAAYERRIRTCSTPLVKTPRNSPDEPDVDKHNYVVFGGTLWQFAAAAVQRFCCGINCHGRGFALFWINMQRSQRWLEQLKRFCDERGMKPKVDADGVMPFDEVGLQSAFRNLHPPPGERRKVTGKIVMDMTQQQQQQGVVGAAEGGGGVGAGGEAAEIAPEGAQMTTASKPKEL